MSDIFNTIISALSPREAEAKVVGDKRAMAILSNIIANSQSNQGDKLNLTYADIVKAANALKNTVNVNAYPGISKSDTAEHPAGEYIPHQQQIYYDPRRSDIAQIPNTLVHELLHFLSYTVPNTNIQNDIPAQHNFIDNTIGNVARGIQPSQNLSDSDKQMLQHLISPQQEQ